MIYTTVIWNSKPETEVGQALKAKALDMLQDNEIYVQYSIDQGVVTARRGWPDSVTAEAWIEFVQQYNPVSAIIDTEA